MLSRLIETLKRSRPAQATAALVTLAVVAAVVFALGAGSPAAVTSTTEQTTTTTTTAPPETATTIETTTTTAQPEAVSPLNGLPVEDPTLLERRVLAVKIDNHPLARPQAGIEQADAVIELMVEGVTRFISLWQQSDTEYLGPMRSGRPTDQTLLAAFNEPTFALSGAQSWVQQMIRNVGIHLIGEVRPATFRVSGRRAPHNLFTDTNLLRQFADESDYPDEPPIGPIWEFGPMPDDAEPASRVVLDFLGNPVEWTWDGATGVWLRTLGGQESNWVDQDGEEHQIGYPVLVLLFVEQYQVGGLPSSRTAGSGRAYVLADGKVREGTWEREEITEWFTLRDPEGETILVPPGQVWISLVPTNGGFDLE